MKTIRIGVIGLGFGRHIVRTLIGLEGYELAAIADRRAEDLNELAALAHGRAYRDGLEMMHEENLDAVSICVSPASREVLMEAAADAGLAMVVEKPWATDRDHARRLAEMCTDKNATIMVGFSFRFHPVIRRLHTLLQRDLGPGRLLNGHYVFDWLPPAESWLWNPQNGNGIFNENSCHLIDAVNHLMGRPTTVYARAGSMGGRPSADHGAVVIGFENGSMATLTLGGIGESAFRDYPRIEVMAEKGQAQLLGRNHVWERLRWSSRNGTGLCEMDAAPEQLGRTRYTDAFEHFRDCLFEKRNPESTVEEAIRTVDVAMAITESARTGKEITIP
jgi:predicted dehydrogenase